MKSSEFRPFGSSVLVRQDEVSATTEAGLHLPPGFTEDPKNRPKTGVVIAVGPGDGITPIPVPVGARVVFGQYSGTWTAFDDVGYFTVVPFSELLGMQAGTIAAEATHGDLHGDGGEEQGS